MNRIPLPLRIRTTMAARIGWKAWIVFLAGSLYFGAWAFDLFEYKGCCWFCDFMRVAHIGCRK